MTSLKKEIKKKKQKRLNCCHVSCCTDVACILLTPLVVSLELFAESGWSDTSVGELHFSISFKVWVLIFVFRWLLYVYDAYIFIPFFLLDMIFFIQLLIWYIFCYFSILFFKYDFLYSYTDLADLLFLIWRFFLIIHLSPTNNGSRSKSPQASSKHLKLYR